MGAVNVFSLFGIGVPSRVVFLLFLLLQLLQFWISSAYTCLTEELPWEILILKPLLWFQIHLNASSSQKGTPTALVLLPCEEILVLKPRMDDVSTDSSHFSNHFVMHILFFLRNPWRCFHEKRFWSSVHPLFTKPPGVASLKTYVGTWVSLTKSISGMYPQTPHIFKALWWRGSTCSLLGIPKDVPNWF